jgi:hypothetical protein
VFDTSPKAPLCVTVRAESWCGVPSVFVTGGVYPFGKFFTPHFSTV